MAGAAESKLLQMRGTNDRCLGLLRMFDPVTVSKGRSVACW